MNGFHEFPIPFIAGLFGLLSVAWNRGRRLTRDIGTRDSVPLHLTLLALGWIAYLPQLVTRGGLPHYFAPSAPVFSALAAGIVGSLWSRRTLRRFVVPAMAAMVMLQGAAFYTDTGWTQSRAPLDALRSVADVVRRVTPPEKRVVTLDLAVTVEAHRKTPDELAMGPWSYWRTIDFEEASRLRVLRTDMFWWLLFRSDVSTVVLTDFSVGVLLDGALFGCRSRPFSEQELKWAFPELTGFDLVEIAIVPSFGPTYILQRNETPREYPRLPVGWVRPSCQDLTERSPYRSPITSGETR